MTLNEFLTEKGVSTDLRVKRSLAQAFALPMDKGTPEQENALLRVLQVGEAAINGKVSESFRVEVASFDGEPQAHSCSTLEEAGKIMNDLKPTSMCRSVKLTVITEIV